MSKLYELTEAYNKVYNMIDDETDFQMIQDTLESIEGDISYKIESLVKLMKTIQADEDAIKAEEERLYKRRDALKNRREGIKTYIESNMSVMGLDKLKTALFTVSMQNNAPSVKIINELELNEWAKGRAFYWITKPPELSKKALLEDMKSGVNIPGAEIQQTKSLRVR